jgi:hypothetical protein
MSGTYILYDDATFRATLPFFSNETTYTPVALQQFFNNGISYISNYNRGALNGNSRQLACFLMTAHLAALTDLINEQDGSVPNLVVDATIDKTKVTVEPPPSKTQFHYWLNLTPWGQQLLPLLAVSAAGGFYVGGRCEGLAFRRVFGGFGFGR